MRESTNAAWLRLAVLTFNVLKALKLLALPPELLTARPERLRFLIFCTPGKLIHHARRPLLRLARAWKCSATGDRPSAGYLCLQWGAPKQSPVQLTRTASPSENQRVNSALSVPPERQKTNPTSCPSSLSPPAAVPQFPKRFLHASLDRSNSLQTDYEGF